MANNFTRFPVTGGDNGVWGPLLLANIRDMVGLNSCKLYDDSGTLKVSQGKIGINDNTNEGIMTIDTITTISIAGVSNSNWAQIEVELSGGVPVFSATDISGATDSDALPTNLTDSYVGSKNGFYINATKRTIGAIYKDSGGNLSFVVNCLDDEKIQGDRFFSINNNLLMTPKAIFSYVATGGGSASTGAWTTLQLNTTVFNLIPGCSLASNQITLPAGKYLLSGNYSFYRVTDCGLKLQNITLGSLIDYGQSGYASPIDIGNIFPKIKTYFEISSTTILEFQYYCAGVTASGFNLGFNNNPGFPAVPHRIFEFTKIDG